MNWRVVAIGCGLGIAAMLAWAGVLLAIAAIGWLFVRNPIAFVAVATTGVFLWGGIATACRVARRGKL